MKQTILIADDEKHIRDMVQEYLGAEGFRVVTAASGRKALFVARQESPDLILLDIMMPELNGFDFVRVYGRESDTPIIMLTAKLEANDKVLGLELGADDYITKPFNMRELTARIRAVLRRLQKPGQEKDLLRANGIVVDVAGKRVFIDDQVVNLTRTEFHILATLMAAPGRVFARLDLIDSSQGSIYAGYERSIDTHIRRLRRKIEADIAHDIRTPLTVITGYTEGLSEEKLTPSVATFQVMHAQVCLLQHLLDDLHTLSLSDGGDLVLQKQRVDPRALLERTAVTYLQQAEAQNIILRVNAPSDLPLVNVDIERMVQVLNNLVGNALRYTPAGGEIALAADEQAGRVVLRVRDTGAGIATADLPNIFERFYRADHVRQRTDTQSSGLGLAIAKAIVEAHGGHISVTSQLNIGTTFTMLMN